MFYLIDGYNLIFSLSESKETFQKRREKVIYALQKQFAKRKASGILVFDGSHRRDEESGLSYPSPLIVAFAPKGQSADEYIVERVRVAKNPKEMVVVTNDRGLKMHAKSFGAKTASNDEFIEWLQKSPKKKKEKEPMDTKQNIDRLLKIFEEKLNQDDED